MASPKGKPAKQRADGQVTGLSGELFVAAELLKRGLQTSITFGNAKAIDLIAVNPKTKCTFTVQVKSVRRKNPWPISHAKIFREHVYVFVLLNEPGEPVEYFVVPGSKDGKRTRSLPSTRLPGVPGHRICDVEEIGLRERVEHL